MRQSSLAAPPDGEGAPRHFIDRQSAVTRLATKVVDRLQATREGNGGQAESGRQAGRQGQHLPHTSPPCQLSVPLTCAIQCPTQQRTFSTSAKLIWSTLRSTGTTRPLGVDTATLMS